MALFSVVLLSNNMKFNEFRFLSDRIDFETHLKYVTRLAELSSGLHIECNLQTCLNKRRLIDLDNKSKLISLTAKSIKNEYDIVQFDKEYSTASVLWLPIKTYYLIYHTLCVINYMLTGNPEMLNEKHSRCVDGFTKMLGNGSLLFSQPFFNQVFDFNIFNFREVSGEHLRADASDDLIYKLILKKIAGEKIDNFKIVNSIPDVRSRKNRDRVEKFKNSLTVSIFDFFYLMRLRLNYRNINFIDNIPSKDTKIYFEKYYKTAANFFICFNSLRKSLIEGISK